MRILEALRTAVRRTKVARAFALAGEPKPQPAIDFDTAGIGVSVDPAAEYDVGPGLEWSTVVEVRALKRDMLTTDLMCLQFVTSGGQVLEVHEEMACWSDLLDGLPGLLPGSMNRQQIYAAVMQPAFTVNETVVYRRVS
jgi:hypothetical protein